MCKLLLGIKKGIRNEDFEDAIAAQIPELRKEKHGIGAVVKTKKGLQVYRELDDYDSVFAWVRNHINDAEMVAIHTRTMTTGKVCLRNCHFFENNGYYFAHNGLVREYNSKGTYGAWNNETKTWEPNRRSTLNLPKPKSIIHSTPEEYDTATKTIFNCTGCANSYRGYCRHHKKEWKMVADYDKSMVQQGDNVVNVEEEDVSFDKGIDVVDGEVTLTDSEQFLKSLKKPFTLHDISLHIKDKDFGGMGVLLTEEQVWLLVQKPCYVLRGKDFAVFTSYSPEDDFEVTSYGKVANVFYEEGTQKHEIKAEKFDLIYGVYEVKNEFNPLQE